MHHRAFGILESTGLGDLTLGMGVMWLLATALLYLGVVRRFQAILLVPLAFGALLANLPVPGGGDPGLVGFLAERMRLDWVLPFILLGVGALTDFGPMLAEPRSFVLGVTAQVGVFVSFALAALIGFEPREAAAIGLLAAADGPSSLFVAAHLAPSLLAGVAFTAFGCQCVMPLVQPLILRWLTTPAERRIRMGALREVSRLEKLVFALVMTIVGIVLMPAGAPLVAMFTLGNFLRECGVGERWLRQSHTEISKILAVVLGLAVGLTLTADRFLRLATVEVFALGVVALVVATAAGVLVAKGLSRASPRNPLNPLIGAAGVAAMPAGACLAQREAQKADPGNVVLLHAAGANVAGLMGAILAAGYFVSTLR